jgi:hypothetical protein
MVDMAVRGVVVDARRFLGPLRLMQLTFSYAQHSGLLSLDRPYVNIFVFKISKYVLYYTEMLESKFDDALPIIDQGFEIGVNFPFRLFFFLFV